MTRILVVEDEPGIALGLEDDLTLEGYAVEVLHDGLAASKRARETPFDLIVLDVMLPGKDGFEVCRELRRHGIQTPILMLTARAQESEKVVGFEVGADDYVIKPFGPRELRARIAALLRRSQSRGRTDNDADRRRGGGLRPRGDPSRRCRDAADAARIPAAATSSSALAAGFSRASSSLRRRGDRARSSPIASSTTTSAVCGGRSKQMRLNRAICATCGASGTAWNAEI